MISGPANPNPHLVTVAELLNTPMPLCCNPGPVYSRCVRAQNHLPPCAALGTDGAGAPVVHTWYRPTTDSWPLSSPLRPSESTNADPGQ